MQKRKPVYEPVVTTKKCNWWLTDRSLFQQLVGALLYLAVSTRPDVAFAVNILSSVQKSDSARFYCSKKSTTLFKGREIFIYLFKTS